MDSGALFACISLKLHYCRKFIFDKLYHFLICFLARVIHVDGDRKNDPNQTSGHPFLCKYHAMVSDFNDRPLRFSKSPPACYQLLVSVHYKRWKRKRVCLEALSDWTRDAINSEQDQYPYKKALSISLERAFVFDQIFYSTF